MTKLLILIAALGLPFLIIRYVLTAKPKHIATFLRALGPILLGILGMVMLLTGRVVVGVPVLIFAITMWMKSNKSQKAIRNNKPKSTLRTASLEMLWDHKTGAMNGVVLMGSFEGAVLDDLDEGTLMSLAKEMANDEHSLQLFETYLDRRLPNWRQNHEADIATWVRGSTQTGAMTEQEAYQILGLEAGATIAQISQAHGRLMQSINAGVGDSTFLAKRIDEAKDFLLRTHNN